MNLLLPLRRGSEETFSIVDNLRKKGVSFVYISHKMDEVFQICDDVAVLRDGKMIMKKAVKDTNMNELIKAMVGRSLDKRFPDVVNTPGRPYFEVRNLTTKYEPILEKISFTVKKAKSSAFMVWWGREGANCLNLCSAFERSLQERSFWTGRNCIFQQQTGDGLQFRADHRRAQTQWHVR